MKKIILRSLGYCLLMTAATISQMIAPPISRTHVATVAFADTHHAPDSNVADFHKGNSAHM